MSRARKFETNISNDVAKEIPYLIAQGKLDKQSITNLLKKYSSNVEFVDKVIQGYTEKIHHIKTKAKKLAKSILKRSGQYDSLPLHILLKKAQKYKSKLGLNDLEMEEFNRILFSYLNDSPDIRSGLDATNTNIGRFFGTHDPLSRDSAIIKDNEYSYMNEILKLYAVSKPIHAACVVQAISYSDCAPQTLLGVYNREKHNPACSIHAVIAALFIPSLKIIDRYMIFANLAYIVKCRYDKLPIASLPDYFLFHALISDPTDVVCDIESPLKDLRNRIMIQESLWNSVLAIRNGRYFDCISNQFAAAIDNCKVTNYDSPDLVYLGDESTVIRRLFQTFSFRPTIITTVPIYGVIAANPMNLPVNMNRVTSLPMITIRLPTITVNEDTEQVPVDLLQSFNQPYKYFESNVMVPKLNQILFSKEIIVFHVPRRVQNIQWKRLIQPYNFNNLFPTITGFEKANTRLVAYRDHIGINKKAYALRSVVAIEVSPVNDDIIIGTTALIKSLTSELNPSDKYYHYHPRRSALFTDTESNLDPVTEIQYVSDIEIQSFEGMVSKYGTIYIYQNPDDVEAFTHN